MVTFYCLGALLVTDMVWGYISHLIHFPHEKSHVARWSIINVVAGLLAFMIVAYPFERKPWVLMVIAIVRSVADYRICWRFYFPSSDVQQGHETTGSDVTVG